MNNASPFIRKVAYIACIGVLLIPLSMVSRPETRDGVGEIQDPGGVLSSLRDENDLSQAKISEIDPASETMKLASLGLRGVAVNMLWMQAMEHKKKENYEQLASTLQALIKIQPNFVKVWEYQAHNLAYNVSMEFDDYEYRYNWVKKGLAFLKKGIAYNKQDHRVPSKLGFFTGNKFGKSDEKLSFRRMFRKDDEFHREMSDYIDPESYVERNDDYGADSWKMAYQWYDYSRKMVEEQSCPQREPDMLFYMYRPAQIRNQALSLQDEFRTDEVIQEIWREAFEEWLEYGNEEITNTLGVTVRLEGLAGEEAQMKKLRAKLDELVPAGTRQKMTADLMASANLPADEVALTKLDPDERTDEQNQIVRNINRYLSSLDEDMDAKIASEAPEEKRIEANRIALEIAKIQEQIRMIDKDSNTINYAYWRARTDAEHKDMTVSARQSLHDARQMWRRSIYDDEYDFDYKTKTKTITQEGAITLYLNAFSKWAEVFEAYPKLMDGQLADQITESMQNFRDMLLVTNREWPENFPLQSFIDFRFNEGYRNDRLPTSEELAEMRSGREERSAPEMEDR